MAQAGTGVDVIAAFKQASTWWTAVSCNTALAGIHIENDGLPLGSPELIPDTSLGSAWEKGNDLGNIIVDGPINFHARYDSLNTLWALAMGAAAAPTDLSDGAYEHVLTLTSSTPGYFGTYATWDGVATRECPSVKVTGFVFGGQGGQACTLDFNTMCDDRIIDSAVNTSGDALNAVTWPVYDDRIIFDDVQIRINAQGGAALADSDSFYASRFQITLDRPHEAVFVTNLRRTRSEPVANGKATIRIALTEDSYVDTSRITALRSRTPYKMDIRAFGARAIGTSTTYYYRLEIQLAAVFYSATRYPYNGPGRIIPDLELVAELPAAAVTFTEGGSLSLPMRMILRNATSTRALS